VLQASDRNAQHASSAGLRHPDRRIVKAKKAYGRSNNASRFAKMVGKSDSVAVPKHSQGSRGALDLLFSFKAHSVQVLYPRSRSEKGGRF
jgi:hypothetical protein